MGMTAAVIALFLLALVAANLPWLTERRLLLLAPPAEGKREWLRLLEWLLLFGVAGLLAAGLEYQVIGEIYAQDWEFWVVNLCLFAVFALPGFIYHHDLRRYLRKRR